MSDTEITTTTTQTADPVQAFISQQEEVNKAITRRGKRSGPSYSPRGNVGVIYDQVFGRGITPAGTTTCPDALAAAGTGQALQLAVIASNANEGPLNFPQGATLTVSFLHANREDGEFTDEGTFSACMTAGTGGISADPDETVFRMAIPDGCQTYVKVKLTFTGSVTGGTVDCVLARAAR